ncbi:hydrolase [Clostridium aestuarii]|uniref:Hydrolase n=1 Tax=Clostridium aestuarii TaxID=338193 RepID=A0ABT4D1C6_9CLOT|nr:hydrolase [Clostridium aestuarii]MCY6485043.1 hydrolase [Clostridium aestuarii]
MNKFTLFKEDSLLLIIDIQEKLVSAMKDGNQVIKNTNILISAAKEMNLPIFFTEQYPKGLGGTSPEINDHLENAIKFEKNSFSACSDNFIFNLKETGKKKIILTGTETHICVFQTARDLISLGYEVFVVSDGVISRTKENYMNGLDLMKNMGAIITNTETVLFDLLKKSGTPEFKLLSKLIK